jgi:hypothetical protein
MARPNNKYTESYYLKNNLYSADNNGVFATKLL